MFKLLAFFIGTISIFFLSLTSISIVLFAQSLPLVISEFMSNPAKVSDSDGEWFEVYNPNTESVSLEKIIIKDQGKDSHEITENIVVTPHESIVICRNRDQTVNGGVPCKYQYEGITLANDSDEIMLEKDGSVVAAVSYSKETFPIKNGKSVEISSITANPSDPGNWHEASTPYGTGDFGTPGSTNSPLVSPTLEPSDTPKPTKVPTSTKNPTATKNPTSTKTSASEIQKPSPLVTLITANTTIGSQKRVPTHEIPTAVFVRLEKDASGSTKSVLAASTSAAIQSSFLEPWHFLTGSAVSLIAMVASAFYIHRKQQG